MTKNCFLIPIFSEGTDSIVKVRLPDGTRVLLDDKATYEERLKKVNELLEEWTDVIKENSKIWFSNAVKYFLDSLSSYLLWSKDIKSEHEILSKNKLEIMNRRSDRRKEIPVGNMTKVDEFKWRDKERRLIKEEIKEEVKKSEELASEVVVYYEK